MRSSGIGLSRRRFLAGGVGLCAAAGCRTPLFASSRRLSADYWCTWQTQCQTKRNIQARGAVRFAGDQGGFGDRDNLNEEILFGEGGWAALFPEVRSDLVFLLDDGWDVPYGADGGGDGVAAFGSHVPDAVRFPSLRGTTAQKLRQLNGRVQNAGWLGAGIWVAPQMSGEVYDRPCPDWNRLTDDLKRKLSESAEAGVLYWKVDWGVHNRDIRYRQLMSELKASYAPDLIIDHCWGVDNAMNGRPYPYDGWKASDGPLDVCGTLCRMTDNPLYDEVARRYGELMVFSDVFRTYDTVHPMSTATALDRAVFEVECADRMRARAVINTEDEDLMAATLGLEFSMMRSPICPPPTVPWPWNRNDRMAEAVRCIRWHRIAPPFGSDRGIRLCRGDKRLEENWFFADKSTWWSALFGREIRQTAPAVVSRGLPLPDVTSAEADGSVPFVTAGRNPSGAKSVAAIPLLTQKKGYHTPRANVVLDARLSCGEPFGAFGVFSALTVTVDAPQDARVLAADLAGGERTDITESCPREKDRLTLPGGLLARLGRAQNAPGDPSSPGVLVELV